MAKRTVYQDLSSIKFQPLSTHFNFKNETSQIYNKRKVLGYAGKQGKHHYWYVQCECNKISKVSEPGSNLKHPCNNCDGTGVASDFVARKKQRKSTEFSSWCAMVQRCYNPKRNNYHNYGGRGIKVCNRWKPCKDNSAFQRFLEDMGSKPGPGYSIERLDNDKDYSPENCKWATKKEQCNNTRHNKRIAFQGEIKTVMQWSELTGIHRTTICNRLDRGWSVENTLTVIAISRR